MYHFSPCKHLSVDENHGSIMLFGEDLSHGEMLDTFIILYKESLEDFLSGKVVEEKRGIAASTNSRLKSVQKSGKTITLKDPSHIIEVGNGRKKTVLGVITFDICENTLARYVLMCIREGFFDLSMRTTKTNSEKKVYAKDLARWTSFANQYGNAEELMMQANANYYTSIPMGILPR